MELTLVGGLTSEWFGLEASLLTLGLTIGALSFVLEPSPKTARRMFYGSLLYLPAFMAGLLLHRLPIEQKAHNLAEKSELDGVLYGADLQDKEQKRQDRNSGNLLVCNHALQLPMLPWLHSLSYRCPSLIIKAGDFGRQPGYPCHLKYFSRSILRSTL